MMKPGDNMAYDYYLYHLEDNEIRRCIYMITYLQWKKEMSKERMVKLCQL